MLYSGVSWAMDLLTHLFHYFLLSYHHFLSYLINYILCSILCLCNHIFLLCHEWWSFTFQCIGDDQVPFHSYFMDIGLETLNWKCHFVRESLYTPLFESICISLCILIWAHLFIFRVCTGKRKKKWKKMKKRKEKKKVISACIQCHPPLSVYIGHWKLPFFSQLLMRVPMWTFRRLSFSCVYLVMYFTYERQVTFS